jgi:surfeit locus 1 family protein
VRRVRSLLAPGLAALVALAILLGLGTWQVQRMAWKEGLIAQIEARARGEAGTIMPEESWSAWQQTTTSSGASASRAASFMSTKHRFMGWRPPSAEHPRRASTFSLRYASRAAAVVMVNRGFVPTELRDPARRPNSQPAGEVTVNGLVRAPEERTWFTPDDVPGQNRWFTRDPAAIASARNLDRVAPFYIEADATPNPGGWPRGGQNRLNLPNNHLQYALTWYGIALTLVGVFTAFAWRRLKAG